MVDSDTKQKIAKKKTRNMMARVLRDDKGPYAIKTINPKKTEYKREKLRPKDIIEDENDV